MSYQQLKTIKFGNINNYNLEMNKRLNNIVKVDIPLEITGFLREEKVLSEKNNLFYLPTKEISFLIEELFLKSKMILNLSDSLPSIIQQSILIDNLITEIKSTNEIEGIYSTRKEIQFAIDSVLSNSVEKAKFNGISKLYLECEQEKYSSITTPENIREIYDELFENELSNDLKPDGILFRKEKVYVNKGGKHVHEGVSNPNNSEPIIIEYLNDLIAFMKSHEVPPIEKCLISHYYLEYIHPFYDGNGRLGRFIVCSYLSRKLDKLSAISFSTSINKKKTTYGKAFSDVSHPSNKGEITFFLIDMLKLILDGQQTIIEEMQEGVQNLSIIEENLESLDITQCEKVVLFLLAQEFLFSKYYKLQDRQIKDLLSKDFSKKSVSISFNNLRNKNYIVQSKKRPSIHTISKQLLEHLLNNNLIE